MKCIAPVIPVWAERIEVEEHIGNRWKVRGFGRKSYTLIPEKCSVAIEAFDLNSNKPIHLKFANASSIDELREFVCKYGPVQGKLEPKRRHKGTANGGTGKEDLVVGQDLSVLVREQQLFRAAALLLKELQGHRQDRVKIRKLISRIRELYPIQTADDRKAKVYE